jgi:hypothetical protein
MLGGRHNEDRRFCKTSANLEEEDGPIVQKPAYYFKGEVFGNNSGSDRVSKCREKIGLCHRQKWRGVPDFLRVRFYPGWEAAYPTG